jgi:hypothetical protein
MRVVLVYKQAMDYSRQVDEYLHDFEKQTGHTLQIMDPESPEGVSFAKAHDLWEFPSVVALADDGSVLNTWKGLPLPLINELSYYVQ